MTDDIPWSTSSISYPKVPPVYGRSDFRLAAQALEILHGSQEERVKLEKIRDALSVAVAKAAPLWNDHVRTVAALDDVLRVTQNAQDLATNVSSLVDSQDESTATFVDDDEAREMEAVLQNITKLEQKVQLLAEVRNFAALADEAEKAEDGKSRKAILLGKAIRLGRSPSLVQVRALDGLRAKLERLASSIGQDLVFTICDGIFSVDADDNVPTQSIRSVTADSRSSLTATSQQPHGQKPAATAYARACNAAKQLLDLQGPGAVRSAIERAASSGRVDDLLMLALDRVLASSAVSKTVAQAAVTEKPSASATYRSRKNMAELGARGREGRPICAAMFQSIAVLFRGVMDRLVRLDVDVLDRRDHGPPAAEIVWAVIEERITTLVKLVLGILIAAEKDECVGTVHPSVQEAKAICLLDDLDLDKGPRVSSAHSWMEEKMADFPGVIPSIYNLSVVYEPLLRIALLGMDNVSNVSATNSLIMRLLEDAGSRLVDAVSVDISSATQPVLNLRPATLLHVANENNSPGEARAPRSFPSSTRSRRLPLLPAIREIAPIVADVLSLASVVPGVGAKLGHVLSKQVLMPFAARCKAALDLVSSRTIAGAVYERVVVDNPTMTARDIMHRINTGENRSLVIDAIASLHHGRSSRSNAIDTQYNVNATLKEHEWKAILQLVAGVSALASEIRRCAGEDVSSFRADIAPLLRFHSSLTGSDDPPSDASFNTGPLSTSSLASSIARRKTQFPSITKRQNDLLCQEEDYFRLAQSRFVRVQSERDTQSDSQRAVACAVSAAQSSLGALEAAVVDRAIFVLHADISTRCYVLSHEALRGIYRRMKEIRTTQDVDRVADSTVETSKAKIFGQQQDFLQTSVGSSDSAVLHHHLDYDEFGDLIEEGGLDDVSDEGVEAAISGRFEDDGMAESHMDCSKAPVHTLSSSPSLNEICTDVESAARSVGHQLGEELRWIEAWLRENIGESRRRFIMLADADSSVAAGLAAGSSRMKASAVLVAAAARSFLYAAREQDSQMLRDDLGNGSATKHVNLLINCATTGVGR